MPKPIETLTGADAADFQAAIAPHVLALLAGAAVPEALGNRAGALTLDYTVEGSFALTATGNLTLSNPSSEAPGTLLTGVITQDATGGRELSAGDQFTCPVGTQLSPLPGSTDFIALYVQPSGQIFYWIVNQVPPDGGVTGAPGVSVRRPGTISRTSGAASALDITAYRVPDKTGTKMIVAPALTQKTVTAGWSAGASGGLFDNGTAVAANSTAHIYAICMADGSGGDYIASASASAPTMPSGYADGAFVRIASLELDGSKQFIGFKHKIGDMFLLAAPVLDFSGANNSTTAVTTRTLSVPKGIEVDALVRINGSAVYSVLEAIDTPIVTSTAFGASGGSGFDINSSVVSQDKRVRTNTLGQVHTVSGLTGTLSGWTKGWIDVGLASGI